MKDSDKKTADKNDSWLRYLNRILIGLGVLAFGLIIADRLKSVLSVDHVPEVASTQNTETDDVPTALAVSANAENQSPTSEELPEAADGQKKAPLELKDVFGSRVVFVSTAKPMYVVTEDEKRFDVGSPVSTGLKFAGATPQQIILDDNGNLIVIGLPDPVVQ